MKRTARLTALALALSLLLTGCAAPGADLPDEAVALAAQAPWAPYPNEADFTDQNWNFDAAGYDAAWEAWQPEHQARQDAAAEAQGALDAFFSAFTAAALTGQGNQVVSPVNVYLALAMLAECTDGETQAELLRLLGEPDPAALQAHADAIWRAQHYDDGRTTSRLSASLWLDESVEYREETLSDLALRHRADSYCGDLGSDRMNELLQTWLSDHTGGLLKDAAGQMALDPDTILALATAIYFQGAWRDEFPQGLTAPQTFHAPSGDLETDFMRRSDVRAYYRGDGFTAVSLAMSGGEQMWLVLPDEGVTPQQLLADGTAQAFLLSAGETSQVSSPLVHLAVPKFDVKQSQNLIPVLKALGLTRVFDGGDFSPIFADCSTAVLSQAAHAARVKIDEQGVEAAAFTVLAVDESAAAPPPEEVTFTLDRPFLFSVTGNGALPLFTGVVETPAQ